MVGVANICPSLNYLPIKDGKAVNFKWQDEFVGATHRQQPQT